MLPLKSVCVSFYGADEQEDVGLNAVSVPLISA